MPAWMRAGFTPRPAFGDLESPAVCQSGAEVILVFAARRPTVRPAATLGPLKEPSDPRGFAGTDPGSRKGSNRISEPGSAPARFETPDHTGDS